MTASLDEVCVDPRGTNDPLQWQCGLQARLTSGIFEDNACGVSFASGFAALAAGDNMAYLETLAGFLGTSVDNIIVMMAMISIYPLGFLHTLLPTPKIKHVASFALGILIIFLVYHLDGLLACFVQPVFTYILLKLAYSSLYPCSFRFLHLLPFAFQRN